jgi:hypothetical protein
MIYTCTGILDKSIFILYLCVIYVICYINFCFDARHPHFQKRNKVPDIVLQLDPEYWKLCIYSEYQSVLNIKGISSSTNKAKTNKESTFGVQSYSDIEYNYSILWKLYINKIFEHGQWRCTPFVYMKWTNI